MSVERTPGAHLVAKGISVERGGRVLLSDVDFEARAGRLTAIIGPNGAGKSTLMKSVAGLIDHDGRVEIDGEDFLGMSRRARARAVAWVPQESRLTISLTTRALVAQARYAHMGTFGTLGKGDREAVDRALAEVDATHLADRRWQTLSGGEKRRALLARGLATGAKILLLDEPSTSLDMEQALRLMLLLRALVDSGRTVVAVMHELELAMRYADDAHLIANGVTVATGRVSDVLSPDNVRDVFRVKMIPNGAHRFVLNEGGSS